MMVTEYHESPLNSVGRIPYNKSALSHCYIARIHPVFTLGNELHKILQSVLESSGGGGGG